MLRPKRILLLSLAVTSTIAIIEAVGGILSQSISLVSDAVHVFTDVMAIGLSLFAVTVSARSHSGAMTFGYHRAEVLAAFANGLLLAVISMWILYEAFSRVMSPQAIDVPLMLIAASIGLVGNLTVMLLLRRHAGKSINIHSAFIHVVYNTISSIAVIGTGFITLNTGITIVDPLCISDSRTCCKKCIFYSEKEHSYIARRRSIRTRCTRHRSLSGS